MMFYAFRRKLTDYAYIATVDASTIPNAIEKLKQQGYSGKFLLVPEKNIVTIPSLKQAERF